MFLRENVVHCARGRACANLPDVIARSEATGQSALLAVELNEGQSLGQIRSSLRIRRKYCSLFGYYCGENGLPHQCAHWFAMTGKRRRRRCGYKDVLPRKGCPFAGPTHWAAMTGRKRERFCASKGARTGKKIRKRPVYKQNFNISVVQSRKQAGGGGIYV